MKSEGSRRAVPTLNAVVWLWVMAGLFLGGRPSALAEADLGVSIASSPNPLGAGSNLTYTITVTNAGPEVATDVMLTNKLSEGQMLAGGGGSGACPDPGPLAWWKAEGNPNDSADSHDGMLFGGAGYAAGKVGQAFAFDGAGDYFEVPDSAAFRPTNFTIEGWFRPGSPTSSSAWDAGARQTHGSASR